MKNNPLISVILPAYNAEKYIGDAITSILNQTYTTIEIICINDGSNDSTLDILKSFHKQFGDKITILENETKSGIAFSRNRGITIAKGDLIAFMDADDIALPERFEKQISDFNQDPELSISFTLIQSFISPELPEEIKKKRFCPKEPQSGTISPTAMIASSAFNRVGLLNESLRVGEFIDWASRATHAGLKHKTINTVLLLRRIHDTNTGVVARDARVDYLKIAREALARKNKNE